MTKAPKAKKPKATFIGNGENDPETLHAFGVDWVKGKRRDIPEEYAAKIAGNDHFEVK